MKRLRSRAGALAIVSLMLLTLTAALVPTRAAAGNGSIAVHGHLCPIDLNGAAATLDDLFKNCVTPAANVGLMLTVDDQNKANAAFDDAGNANFTDVPSGDFQLIQTPPTGYAPRIFCSVMQAQTPPDTGGATPVSEDGTPVAIERENVQSDDLLKVVYKQTEFTDPLSGTISAGANWECDYYYVATEDSGGSALVIYKHNCPADAVIVAAEMLAPNCQEGGTDGIEFTVTDGLKLKLTEKTSNSQVVFKDLPDGAKITVEETFPAGFADAYVTCASKSEKGEMSETFPVDASGGIAHFTVKSGYDIVCDWYDLRATPVTVRISKFACPKGVDPTKSVIAKESDAPLCQPQPYVDFYVSSSNQEKGSVKLTTDAQGYATTSDLPAGDMEIDEVLPKGYGDPIVMCQIGYVKDQPGRETVRIDHTTDGNPAVLFSLKPGQEAGCLWFNIEGSPTKPTPTPTPRSDDNGGGNGGGGGNGNDGGNGNPPVATATSQSARGSSLTIVAFGCESGYDLFAEDAKPAQDCTQPLTGAEFAIGTPGDLQTTGQTGIDGSVTFTNLNRGPYLVAGDLPDGTTAFILDCTSNRAPIQSPFEPLSQLGPSGKVQIVLDRGEQLTCRWFEIPPTAPDPTQPAA